MSEENNNPVLLEMRKLYVGDLSIEVPGAPEIYNVQLNPDISLGIKHHTAALKEEGYYNVSLHLTVTAKNREDEKTIYLIEVEQSGIFEIRGLNEAQLDHALNVYCTTAVYPFAREVISSAIQHAGFPSLFLQPINFEVLYQQQQQHEAQSAPPAQGGEA